DLCLARQHRTDIHFRLANADAMQLKVIARLEELLAAVQQGLGGNTTDVQAGSPQAHLAIIIHPLLHTGRGQAELGGLDGGDVAAGASTDYYHIKLVSHACFQIRSPGRNRLTPLRGCLTVAAGCARDPRSDPSPPPGTAPPSCRRS